MLTAKRMAAKSLIRVFFNIFKSALLMAGGWFLLVVLGGVSFDFIYWWRQLYLAMTCMEVVSSTALFLGFIFHIYPCYAKKWGVTTGEVETAFVEGRVFKENGWREWDGAKFQEWRLRRQLSNVMAEMLHGALQKKR